MQSAPWVEEVQPVEVSLVELVLVLAELTEDEREIFATVDHMVSSGSVRLRPMLETEIPEAW
jgi:hypothetical protein